MEPSLKLMVEKVWDSMDTQKITLFLPYTKPFLFVDEITQISETGVTGNYTFKENEYFYEGHFINNPITPGVILTETMAQIGVVCLGIYLLKDEISVINVFWLIPEIEQRAIDTKNK